MNDKSKLGLIQQILDIELAWFLTVDPQLTSECQKHPEAFKLMRQSPFETWSEQTLALHLEHLIDAQKKGTNLVREKYAKIQGIMLCENVTTALKNSVAIERRWFKDAATKYPNIIKQETGATGFERYLRCELDTFSQDTLEFYYKDRFGAEAGGRNLVIEVYDRIARKLGYSSIEDLNHKQGG